MILKVIIMVTSLRSIGCSYVVDSVVQDAVYLSDYCPKSQFCEEGTHIVCMLYNPNQLMGPHCMQARNVAINPEVAKFSLNIVNYLRNYLAIGLLTYGPDRKAMPRGWAIRQLEWDAELATFAQIKANSCLTTHDMCRGTERFPDPAQLIGSVHLDYFTFRPEDILNERAKKHIYNVGLNSGALNEAVVTMFESIFHTKDDVTLAMVESYPSTKPDQPSPPKILTLLQGDMTHMGCGISAPIYVSETSIGHNIVIVCNFSEKPKEGKPVFLLKHPGKGYTNRSACLIPDYEEFPRYNILLCRRRRPRPPNPKPCEKEGNCEPTLVLLPIITIDHTPDDKLYNETQQFFDTMKSYVFRKKNNTNSNRLRSNPLDSLLNMNETETWRYIEPYISNNLNQTNDEQPIVN